VKDACRRGLALPDVPPEIRSFFYLKGAQEHREVGEGKQADEMAHAAIDALRPRVVSLEEAWGGEQGGGSTGAARLVAPGLSSARVPLRTTNRSARLTARGRPHRSRALSSFSASRSRRSERPNLARGPRLRRRNAARYQVPPLLMMPLALVVPVPAWCRAGAAWCRAGARIGWLGAVAAG
jgi:hypothetical protein